MSERVTTEGFIKKARDVHGERYDYSKTVYKKARDKVTIICLEHGEFEQTPNKHLAGQGCPECAKILRGVKHRNTQGDIIKRFIEVHGNKYDYSNVEYVNWGAKVKIRCKTHGVFLQSPGKHIEGCGCPECGGVKKKDTLRFISDAKTVHGDKYDYSEVEYVNLRVPVKIICPEHGVFKQRPEDHLYQRSGCPECKKLKIAQSHKLPHEEHIATIARMNPTIEVLERVVNTYTKVSCCCKICGYKWLARPCNLKSGRGCPRCARLKRRLSHKEQVGAIKEKNPSILVLEEIISDREKILCRCEICKHEWRAKPCMLKLGKGCPKCARSGFLSHNRGNLYIMVDDLEVPTMMKIGVSIDAKKRKNKVLNSAHKAGAEIPDLYIIKTWSGPTEHMQALEKAMHQALSQYKINFPVKFDGCQEFFHYRPEVFELIEEHLRKFADEE